MTNDRRIQVCKSPILLKSDAARFLVLNDPNVGKWHMENLITMFRSLKAQTKLIHGRQYVIDDRSNMD